MSKRSNYFNTGILVLLTLIVMQHARAVPAKEYDQLILSTKGDLTADQLAPAIRQLQEWHHSEPLDQTIIFDLIVLLDKAHNEIEALPLVQPLDLSHAPTYALRAAAHVLLKTNEFKSAESAYQLLLARLPDDADSQAGLAYSWLGQQRSEQALNYLEHLLTDTAQPVSERQMNTLPLWIALAEIHEQRQQWLQAASAFQRALLANPDFRYAKRELVFSLDRAGLVYLAQYYAVQYSNVFSSAEQAKFAQANAALTIRFGKAQLSADNTRARFNTTDVALVENTLLTQQFGDNNTFRFDRIIALDDREKMQEVLNHYNKLQADHVEVPNYVKSAVADAYLSLMQPEQARDLYREVINTWDKSDTAGLRDLQFMLINAYSDAGQYSEAENLAQQIVDSYALATLRRNGQSGIISPDYARALIVMANLQKNDNHLDRAEQLITRLHTKAPFNTDIRLSWASLLQARGQQRAALDEYSLILIDEPKSLEASATRANILLSLNELDQSRAVLPALLDQNPENKQVKDLAQSIANYDSPSYHLETTLGHGAARSGADSLSSAILYSAPLAGPDDDASWRNNHFRVFTRLDRASGMTVDNISAARNRAAFGIDYRAQNFDAAIELNHTLDDIKNSGVAVAVGWALSDHWQLRGSADSNVIDLPAAAMNQGISAVQEKLNIDWNQNESRRAGAELSTTQYSDTNHRTAINTYWSERWISEPIYKVDTIFYLSGSTNSLLGRAYFNPRQDAELNVDNRAEWLTWHRYQRSFRQIIDLTFGRYGEAGYAPGGTAGLKYEHRWDFENDFGFSYGVGRNFHPYNGSREFRSFFYINISGRIQ